MRVLVPFPADAEACGFSQLTVITGDYLVDTVVRGGHATYGTLPPRAPMGAPQWRVMKRRSFVQVAAGVAGGEILASLHSAAAQSAPLQASRTAHLVDSSIQPGNLTCQDIIFDGHNFLWLYGPKSPPLPNRRYSIAATSVNGELLWQYALPKGGHVSLGTHSGMVLSLAMPSNSPTEPRAPAPVWLLNPSTGSISAAGYNKFSSVPFVRG